MTIWLVAYFAIGTLFCLWNSTSRFFQTWASIMKAQGRSWLIAFVVAIGMCIWPLGALGYLLFWLRAMALGRKRL